MFGSIADTYDTDGKHREERHSESDEDHGVVKIFTLNFAIVLFLDFRPSEHLNTVGEHDVVVADALFLELSKQAVVVLRNR